jgi:hypothetical protein
MAGKARQMDVGNREGKVREDPKPSLDAEREENGCVVAGESEFHLSIETAQWWTTCAETGIEEMQAWRPSEKKQKAVQGFASFLEER